MIHASLESQKKQRPARVSLINGEIVEVKELQKCVFMMSDNREKTVTSLLILPLRSAAQRRRDLFRNYTLIHILEHGSPQYSEAERADGDKQPSEGERRRDSRIDAH